MYTTRKATPFSIFMFIVATSTLFAKPDKTGEQCLSCHDGSGSQIIHRIAGTVYTDDKGTAPAKGATVSLTDIVGRNYVLNETNEFGNFWASPAEIPESRYLTKVNNFQSRLWHAFPKERDNCNKCHIPGGNGEPGREVILDSYPENCHTLCPISNNCQHCHFNPSPYAPKDVKTTGTLNANKPAVIMPSVSKFYMDEKWYDFDPVETPIKVHRPDVFAEGYFSVFDVMIALLKKHNIPVEYEYDSSAKCHFISSLNGKPGEYWYKHVYHNNEFEFMGGFEVVPYRWDELLWKPGTKGEITNSKPPRQEFIEGVKRDGDGFTIVKKVVIDKETFTDVKVTPHNHLSESARHAHAKPLKDGVITVLDVLYSLQDQGKVSNLRLTYYDFVNWAVMKTKKWKFETGSYVGSFIVTRINSRNHRGHNGWFFCHTERKKVAHVTSGIGVIHGSEIIQWYPSQWMGMTVSEIFQIDKVPEYYWDVGERKYKDGDTLDFVTAVDKEKMKEKQKKIAENNKKQMQADLMKRGFMLHNPVPNPFSSSCIIPFSVMDKGQEPKDIRIVVYSIHGKKITTLYQGKSKPGVKKITWQPGQIAPGYYAIIMTFGKNQQSRYVIFNQSNLPLNKSDNTQ